MLASSGGVAAGCGSRQVASVSPTVVSGPGAPVAAPGADLVGGSSVALGVEGARVRHLRVPVVVDLPQSTVLRVVGVVVEVGSAGVQAGFGHGDSNGGGAVA